MKTVTGVYSPSYVNGVCQTYFENTRNPANQYLCAPAAIYLENDHTLYFADYTRAVIRLLSFDVPTSQPTTQPTSMPTSMYLNDHYSQTIRTIAGNTSIGALMLS